ncbi:MAG: hypothetical protein AAF317_21390 [Pseudomonadota bacterium]
MSSRVFRVLSCLGVDLELAMLPHFLKYYAALGVAPQHVHIILNSADPKSLRLAEAETIIADFGGATPKRWVAEYTSDSMWQMRRALQAEVANPDDFLLSADIDEHHVYPASLDEVAAELERTGANACQGYLVDRVAPAGALLPIKEAPSLAEQFPVESEVALSIIGTGKHHGKDATVKLMMFRPSVEPKRGGHNAQAGSERVTYLAGARLAKLPKTTDPSFRFSFPFRVDHYKWTDTRQERFEKRINTDGVSAAGKEFGSKVLAYLSDEGRIDLGRAAVRQGADQPVQDWQALCGRLRTAAKVRNAKARLKGVFA